MGPDRTRKPASVLGSAAFVIGAVGILAAGVVSGAVIVIQSTLRSALLVDSLSTENTVRTLESGAAEDGTLHVRESAPSVESCVWVALPSGHET
jgi:hypothetical protein